MRLAPISPLRIVLFCGILLSLNFDAGSPAKQAFAADEYDVVVASGRIMDPESGLNAVRNLGIKSGKVVAISTGPLHGRNTLDAKGLVVAPGFIDLHEHGQDPHSYQFQAHDGVTTSLELEVGTDDVRRWYADRENKSLINYGVSAGHIPVRMRVMHDSGTFLPSGDAAHREASPEQLHEIEEGIESGLKNGALAVGMGVNYTSAASHEEIIEVFRIASKYHTPVHVHLRYAGILEPTNGLAGLEEVLAAAAATGAPLHVVHITSMGLRDTPQLIAMVEGAQKSGLDVTTECYPYPASSTKIETAIFDAGWQERMGISYHDLQWTDTGERLTAETFEKYRKQGGLLVIYNIPESAARTAVSNPMVMIASDGVGSTGPKVHPRGQGTFSRVLGHYVREEKALDLMTALRKMTLMPAMRLEKRAPMFQKKGRIKVGADADLTIFDPDKIIDRATFEQPLQYSDGIRYVLVNGVPVLRDGELVAGVFPGKPARGPLTVH
jgi:N-acyl-D-aspartate/D-glutamate deacylase